MEMRPDLLAKAATLPDLEPLARECLTHMAFEYIAGGAGDEVTLRANREGFDRIRLRLRTLVDVSAIDTSIELFGVRMPMPVLLAPCAYLRLAHPDGEIETVRGANASGVTLVASTAASTSVDEMAQASERPMWFQLYTSRDRGFTSELVKRAESAGCSALCITVDAPIRGIRDRDVRSGFGLPPGMRRPNLEGASPTAATGNPRPTGRSIYSPNLDPTLTWPDVEWLRSISRVPVLLKGIMTAADSQRAIDAGIHGILVSNHGARTVDTVPGTIEALPEIVEAVQGRVPILLDSGVRRGTDIVKAIAMGAAAVLIGRPYIYGLALAGQEGVRRVVEILQMELEMAMALCGRPDIPSIDSSALW
jgi:4-hydroxymandelate oxidase